MSDDERLGPLWQAYHLASRVSPENKPTPKEHQFYYDPRYPAMIAESPRHLEDRPRVALSMDLGLARMSLSETVLARKSWRSFLPRPIDPVRFGTLLHLGNGVRQVYDAGGLPGYQRNVPNCGNLGSVEVYPIVLDVERIAPGIYHYDSVRHDLATIRSGAFREWLAHFVLPQAEFAGASAVLALTSAVGRLQAKYGPRAYRLALLDVGHVSENLQLASAALGLSACATAGFVDDETNRALGLDGLEDATTLLILIGSSGEVLDHPPRQGPAKPDSSAKEPHR